MTPWQNIIAGVSYIMVGAAVNLVVTMWFFHWKRSKEQPDIVLAEIRQDLDALEAAFVSHTGITINGKSYRTNGGK